MKNKIIFLTCVPDEIYYAWQIEVMLDNFISVNIPSENIQIVVGIHKHIGEWWNKLIEKYSKVNFYFYQDTREDKSYAPSIQPHILHKHWERVSGLYKEIIFYHDCDIVFTREPDFSNFCNDKTWYMSECGSYLGIDYINSKGSNILEDMCVKAYIRKSMIVFHGNSVGGAQGIIKNVVSSFWRQVEDKSNKIYSYLISTNTDIQTWTSGMWAFMWTAWYFDYYTKTSSYLNFSMPTDTWPKWDKNLIYHNAGVVDSMKDRMFYKQDYRADLPYTDHNPYDKQFCSYLYFNEIIKTGKNSCLKKKDDYDDLLNQCKSIFI